MASNTVIFSSTGREMAKIVGLSDKLDQGAAKVKAVADRLAASHVETGAYRSNMAVVKIPGKGGVTDRAVVNTDPQSHIIEAGHWVSLSSGGRKWVAGQFILTAAAIIASDVV